MVYISVFVFNGDRIEYRDSYEFEDDVPIGDAARQIESDFSPLSRGEFILNLETD